MDVVRYIKFVKKIKPFLVFFCFTFLIPACTHQYGINDLEVNYTDGKAVNISFTTAENPGGLKVYVKGERVIPVLGKLTSRGDKHMFTPVIPFTKGQVYELSNGKEIIADFSVSGPTNVDPPEIIAIYPSKDTVPENLLKIYIEFSQPMQETGSVLNFITVTDDTEEREVSIFLDLENELWNKEHNRVTLWLNPGRIKTDLIPNREHGFPLKNGHIYTIHLSARWKSAQGIPLSSDLRKTILATGRDITRPDPSRWKLDSPPSNTNDPLCVHFDESMDAILLQESFEVRTESGVQFEGTLEIINNEKKIYFKPHNIWKKGVYRLLVKAKLEDLAGNNLNRLFDTKLSQKASQETPGDYYELRFIIR